MSGASLIDGKKECGYLGLLALFHVLFICVGRCWHRSGNTLRSGRLSCIHWGSLCDEIGQPQQAQAYGGKSKDLYPDAPQVADIRRLGGIAD